MTEQSWHSGLRLSSPRRDTGVSPVTLPDSADTAGPCGELGAEQVHPEEGHDEDEAAPWGHSGFNTQGPDR